MEIMTLESLPDEIKNRLDTSQVMLFLDSLNESIQNEEMSDGEAFRKAWVDVVKAKGRVVPHTFIFQPGDWDTQSGDGEITEENVTDGVFVINRQAELGVPLQLKYQHSDEAKAIPAGILIDAVEETDNKAYGDLYIYQDARADLDGEGSKILATIDQMADAILTDGMKLSVEAWRDVSLPSYYGDKIISFEPTAMAILPAGVKPAVTEEKIAASRGKERGELTLFSTDSLLEGRNEMELKELIELVQSIKTSTDGFNDRLTAIEAGIKKDEKDDKDADPTVAELQKKIDEQEKEINKTKEEKITAELETVEEEVKAKLNVAEVEKLDEELKEMESSEDKLTMLSRLNSVISKVPDSARQVRAGKRDGKKIASRSGDPRNQYEAEFEKAVKARMKDTNEDRFAASRAVLDDMDESSIETKEV